MTDLAPTQGDLRRDNAALKPLRMAEIHTLAVRERAGTASMADLQGRAPERKWTVKEWIPSGVVTGLYGDGGVGKTLLALQLQASMALGRKWLGVPVAQGRSLGVYCEDDLDELHRRRDDIADAMECKIADLRDAVIWPRLGEDNLLMTFSKSGKGETTAFHDELLEVAREGRFKQVTFDTASDGFGGDENNRSQVRQFVQIALGSIARAINGAVILCAHPSRSGMETGRGDSGSTGWSNAFRSRLYIDVPRDENGRPDLTDQEARTLQRLKANYAARGDRLNLRWRSGVIVRENSQVVASDKRPLNEVFLSLFNVHAARQNLSPSATANNSAPAIFGKLPRAERDGYSKKDFAKEMDHLLKIGDLVIEEYGKDKSRRLALPKPAETVSTPVDAPSTLIDA
jgi:hypothetical protein